MDKLPCEVVRDLLPSYADGLTSELTGRLVESHLETCPDCRAVLERVRAPVPLPESDREEIDFLKRTRRRSRRILVFSLLGALLVSLGILAGRVFLVGEISRSNMYCSYEVEGNALRLDGRLTDSGRSVQVVLFDQDTDGAVTIYVKTVLTSVLYRDGAFHREVSFGRTITQLRWADSRLGDRVLWDQGTDISPLVSQVWETRHPYAGDMSANARTAQALGVSGYLGPFTSELQTDAAPYGWTLLLEREPPEAAQRQMEKDSCLLMAVIDNLDTVSWAYGGETVLTVTAGEAGALAGRDIHACGESPRELEALYRRLSAG